jgi:6-phospho-3-hexuloisomerase
MSKLITMMAFFAGVFAGAFVESGIIASSIGSAQEAIEDAHQNNQRRDRQTLKNGTSLTHRGRRALDEMGAVIAKVDQAQFDNLVNEIVRARRIALYGVGREGLMMRALAMRLFHFGLNAYVVGDMTTPPIGEGDLLLVSAGPGYFESVQAFSDVARKSGARVGCFTAQPEGRTPKSADVVLVIPAQTMANDKTAPTSVLPMGSLYEGSQYLVFELVVMELCKRNPEQAREMRRRHTNLE